MLGAKAARSAAPPYRANESRSTGLRPRLSASGPKKIRPIPLPMMKSVTVSESRVEFEASPKASRMAPNAGSSVSMARADMAVIAAMSAMNSRSPTVPKRPVGASVGDHRLLSSYADGTRNLADRDDRIAEHDVGHDSGRLAPTAGKRVLHDGIVVVPISFQS